MVSKKSYFNLTQLVPWILDWEKMVKNQFPSLLFAVSQFINYSSKFCTTKKLDISSSVTGSLTRITRRLKRHCIVTDRKVWVRIVLLQQSWVKCLARKIGGGREETVSRSISYPAFCFSLSFPYHSLEVSYHRRSTSRPEELQERLKKGIFPFLDLTSLTLLI